MVGWGKRSHFRVQPNHCVKVVLRCVMVGVVTIKGSKDKRTVKNTCCFLFILIFLIFPVNIFTSSLLFYMQIVHTQEQSIWKLFSEAKYLLKEH